MARGRLAAEEGRRAKSCCAFGKIRKAQPRRRLTLRLTGGVPGKCAPPGSTFQLMNARKRVTLDGNEAVANIAYRLNEVMAIYPITPSSTMAELCDQWSAEGRPNLWGTVPSVVQYQSEGGAVGGVHGALQTGSLATTFTASQ